MAKPDAGTLRSKVTMWFLVIGIALVGFLVGYIREKPSETLNESSVQTKQESLKAPRKIVNNDDLPNHFSESVNEHQWRVSGTVTDQSTGNPIQEARVQLFLDPAGEYHQPHLSDITDYNGAFTFLLTTDEAPDVNLAVGVEADGYASELVVVLPKSRKNHLPSDQEITIELHPGKTITGRVEDQFHQPVSQALVGVAHSSRNSIIPSGIQYEVFPIVFCDEQGDFTLSGVPSAEETVSILGRADGYVSGITTIGPEESKDILLILRPGEASLSGRVIDSDGVPLSNIPVQINHQGVGLRQSRESAITGTLTKNITFTDSKGYYHFPSILAGWQKIQAGYGRPVSSSVQTTIFIEPNDKRVCNLRMLTPVTVHGKFVDAKTKEPVSGVRVTNIRESKSTKSYPKEFANLISGGLGVQETISDMNGEFTIRLDRFLGYNQWSSKPRLYYKAFEPYQKPSDDWAYESLTLNSDEEVIEIKLRPPNEYFIQGYVYDVDGETPLPGATILISDSFYQVVPTKESLPSSVIDAHTDQDGYYEVVTPRNWFKILACSQNAAIQKELMIKPNENPFELDLTLNQFLEVSGRVSNSKGEGIPDISVKFKQSFSGFNGNYMTSSADAGLKIMTDLNGAYHQKSIINGGGSFTIKVDPGDSGYLLPPNQSRMVLDDQVVFENIDFVLENPASFEGVVVDEDDNPIVGAVVVQRPDHHRNSPAGDNVSTTETDREGKFQFDDLSVEQGIYQFIVNHPSYNSTTIKERVLEDSPLTIVMTPKSHLEFKVFSEKKDQVTNFEYHLEKQKKKSDHVMPGSNHFYITYGDDNDYKRVYDQEDAIKTLLSQGDYCLYVYEVDQHAERTGSYGRKEFSIEKNGQSEYLEIVLSPELSVTGLVLSYEDEKPISGATVDFVMPGSNRFERKVYRDTSASDGSFSFSSLKDGTYKVEVSKGTLIQTEVVEITVLQGVEIDPIKIYLGKGSTVFGQVIDVDGESCSEGTVRYGETQLGMPPMTTVYDTQGGVSHSMPNQTPFMSTSSKVTEGEYRLENIPPGKIELELELNGSSVLSKTVTVGYHEEMEVDFNLSGMIEVSGNTSDIQQEFTIPGNRPQLLFSNIKYQTFCDTTILWGGSYQTYLYPGVWDVSLKTFEGKIITNTGLEVTIEETPVRQEHDLLFPVSAVDVVIATEGEENTIQGTLTYTHEGSTGRTQSSSFFVNKPRFTLHNQTHGRCRAEFIANDGREFASDGWIEINEASEKILTLIPKDLVEEE